MRVRIVLCACEDCVRVRIVLCACEDCVVCV